MTEQRQPRLLDARYLRWLGQRACDVCRKAPPPGGSNDAAHLKAGNVTIGKPWAGTSKPSDMWATTLCRSCHDQQHDYGDELGWWQAQGIINPFALCLRLYRQFKAENPKAPAARPRKQRPVKKRKPRDQRQKLRSRNDLRKRP